MTQQQMPGEGERKAFVEKLAQFRSTLQPTEQRMLDAMAITAFGAQEQQGDVQGYGWFYGPQGAIYTGPTFYQPGWRTQWTASPWGAAYQTVPVGVWYP